MYGLTNSLSQERMGMKRFNTGKNYLDRAHDGQMKTR